MSSWVIRPSTGGGFVPSSAAAGNNGSGPPLTRRKRNVRSAAATVERRLHTLKPPSPPPKDPPSCADIDVLEEALVMSIRTVGLKPGREKQLAEEATRLRRRRRDWLDSTGSLLREWARHASCLWELHEQELANMSDARREKARENAQRVANLTKQVSEERERGAAAAAQERDAGEACLRAAQEGHELWKKAHKEDIAAAAEREVARTAARLRRDAEQHARSVRESLEAEFSDRLSAALHEKEKCAAEAASARQKTTRLESIARRLEAQVAEASERTRRIERLSQAQKDAAEEMRAGLERRARRLSYRLEEEQVAVEGEKTAKLEAVRDVKMHWKEELRLVDERVRVVVGAKDQALQRVTEHLEAATHRAETAEALLEELQMGICPVVSPSRSRGSLRREGCSPHSALL